MRKFPCEGADHNANVKDEGICMECGGMGLEIERARPILSHRLARAMGDSLAFGDAKLNGQMCKDHGDRPGIYRPEHGRTFCRECLAKL